MTEPVFRDDPYRRSLTATVQNVDASGIVLDRTVFYARGGGQPGDSGAFHLSSGPAIPVLEAVYADDRRTIVHRIDPIHAALFSVGETLEAALDWDRRWSRMRIHTALHLLTTVLPYPVTGGAIGDGEGRLDFDMSEAGDKEAIEQRLNALVIRDLPVTTRWITDEELFANPALVKTMSVKPPTGTGKVRLIAIGDIDLQPCGGTHVASTAEIGPVVVTGIEKKGRQNRRVRIALGATHGAAV